MKWSLREGTTRVRSELLGVHASHTYPSTERATRTVMTPIAGRPKAIHRSHREEVLVCSQDKSSTYTRTRILAFSRFRLSRPMITPATVSHQST